MGESCIFISFMGFFTWGSVRGAPGEKWGKGQSHQKLPLLVQNGTQKKMFGYILPPESFGHQCCSFMLKSSLIAMYVEKRASNVRREKGHHCTKEMEGYWWHRKSEDLLQPWQYSVPSAAGRLSSHTTPHPSLVPVRAWEEPGMKTD